MTSESTIDLDDTESLLAADHDGLLRAASMAGAQVRATVAAVDEGALDTVRDDGPPRTVIWVSGRGTAATAGALLSAALGGSTAQPVVLAADVPRWIGPLDVLVVAGDDPGDPTLVTAAAVGVRRGARVVVAAPYEGPLRDSTAGRVAVLEPRVWVPDEFRLSRYLAVGLAVLSAVDPGLRPELGELADELDAEVLRNSVGRELLTNPAKALADRIFGHDTVLAGDCAATVAMAQHGSAVMVRIGRAVVAAAGLADAVTALRARQESGRAGDLFHDDQIDGPAGDRLRLLALTLGAERTVVAARIGGLADVDLIGAEDVPLPETGPETGPEKKPSADGRIGPHSRTGPGRVEQQLAVLAVRLEMTAAYVRLLQG